MVPAQGLTRPEVRTVFRVHCQRQANHVPVEVSRGLHIFRPQGDHCNARFHIISKKANRKVAKNAKGFL
jgi:hypothetical protein